MSNDIDRESTMKAVKRLRDWLVWAQTKGVPHPYYAPEKARQDNSRVMEEQLADIRAVCAGAEERSQESGDRSQELGTPASVPSPWVVCIDIETTGLFPNRYGILSIGALHPASGKTFSVDCAPRPHCAVNEKAMEVNGQDIKQARARKIPECAAIDMLLAWIRELPQREFIVLGKNPSFDREWIGHRHPIFMQYFSRRVIDVNVLAMSRALTHGIDVLSLKMDEVYEQLGLPVEARPHVALAGAQHAWECFCALTGGCGGSVSRRKEFTTEDTESTEKSK